MCLEEKENLCVSVSGTIIPSRELALLPPSPMSLKPRAFEWLPTCSFLVVYANWERTAVFVMNSEFIFILPQFPYDQLLFFPPWHWLSGSFCPCWLLATLPHTCYACVLPVVCPRAPCRRFFWETTPVLLGASSGFFWLIPHVLAVFIPSLCPRSCRLDMNGRLDAVKPFQGHA